MTPAKANVHRNIRADELAADLGWYGAPTDVCCYECGLTPQQDTDDGRGDDPWEFVDGVWSHVYEPGDRGELDEELRQFDATIRADDWGWTAHVLRGRSDYPLGAQSMRPVLGHPHPDFKRSRRKKAAANGWRRKAAHDAEAQAIIERIWRSESQRTGVDLPFALSGETQGLLF